MESEWEDELLDTLEQKLNRPAILANSLIILSVFSLGWLVYLREILEYGQHGAEKSNPDYKYCTDAAFGYCRNAGDAWMRED